VLWSKGKVVSILPLLDTAPEPLPTLPAGKATIRRGSKGAVVAEWQGIIRVMTDGDFGPKTEAATIAWQKARGLVPDGVVGPKTWALAA
ncbi:peptidoglycan-binding domain-containing protein, partial [Enterovirga rhinocerotis]